MKKNYIFFVAVAAGVALAACNQNKAPEQKAIPPVAVSVDTVAKEPAVYYDQYPATVAALNQVDLKAQVSGYITGIYFKDGEHVRKGQKLYDIDRQTYQASYDQAVANLNVAKAALDKAQQDANRYNDLLKQDAIARQVVDHAMADLQSAKMQVAAAKASVTRAQTDLQYSVIYAPFDGTIGISLVKMGALVTSNQTLLNTVSSDDPMAVDIAADQKEITRFTQLQQHPSPEKDSVFTLLLPDNSVYNQVGHISLLDRAVDAQTGTIKVRLVFANQNRFLKAGMSCNVRVKNNQSSELFVLAPNKAVTEQMGEFFVFVLNDSNKVSQRKVLLGSHVNDKVIIKDGLKEGEKIITEGVQKLKDGAAVQVGAPKGK
ncbi:MAG: efflux RND transporter periplasmic adaptor subunit [Bacteroidota bacterium]|nr:efflux RND transporter periplasmic adaptor subunit [Bacteroidota bacterium]